MSRKGASYLVATIRSLLENADENNTRNAHLVVFLADITAADKSQGIQNIATHFRKQENSGFLHVIEADQDFYPQLDNLKSKFGDSKLRAKWRSKQNVDFAFLMCYCEDISEYYLHLEDDVAASPKFMYKLHDFMSSQSQPWVVIDASVRGHVGKVYHSSDLGNIASYLLLMYEEMPVDWLMPLWIQIHGKYTALPATLFKHLGLKSSLKEKTVNVTDHYFDKHDHKYSGLNPEAVVTSSLIPYEGKPQDAYIRGLGYFWSRSVKEGDFVLIRFHTATRAKEIYVDTGSNKCPGDIIQFGDLEASFSNPSVEKDGGNSCGKFEKIGTFHKGRADVFLTKKPPITCVRLLATRHQSNWFFLREVNIWPL